MSSTSQPARARWVPLLCCIANCVCYADRTNISVALLAISAEMDWDDTFKGLIFGSFFAGYACTQVIGGYCSVSIGGRPVLAVATFFWSIFTLLTPPAARWGLVPLACCRTAMGMAEGLSLPAIHNLIGRWVPKTQRSYALAVATSGQCLGIVTALMSSGLVAWRWDVVFYAYGVIGIVWSITFYFACPASPKETELSMRKREKKVSYARVEENSPSETDTDTLSEIDGHPADKAAKCSQVFLASKALFMNKGFVAVMCAHVAHNYGYYVVLMWLPKYFLSLHIDLQDVGEFAVLPYLCMFAFDVMWGRFVDLLLTSKRMHQLQLRKLSQAVAFLTPSLFLLLLVNIPAPSPTLAMVLISIALAANSASHSGYWANMIDLAPAHAGFVCGVSNTVATLPGIFGNVLTGWILNSTGSWSVVFGACVLCYMLGLVVYLCWADTKQVKGIEGLS